MTTQELAEIIKIGFSKVKAPDTVSALSYILENIGNLSTSVDVLVEELDTATVEVEDLTGELATAQESLVDLQADYDAQALELAAATAAPVISLESGTGIFGSIATATTHTIYLRNNLTYISPCVMLYTGDAGAFKITHINTIDMNVPLDGNAFGSMMITNPEFPAGGTIIIQALAADAGVQKTGTLKFYDRMTNAFPPTGTREIYSLSLSKTYNP